jgi:hypothetical protein|tara:strand:+ start:296 stop:685 length:390 start_codon:yes stop_codon:yes gene_type:complete
LTSEKDILYRWDKPKEKKMNKKVEAKTWHIKDNGDIVCIPGKIKELKDMQELVKGYIEVVNAPMPATSIALSGSLKLKEMIVNEEGMFNSDFKPNLVARRLIAEGSNLLLSDIQEIMGDVFVTDGWSLN